MEHRARSIRTFLGAKDFKLSRQFYSDWGFEEDRISENLSFFHSHRFGFYLQDYYVKKWVDNSMVFLEVDDVDRYWEELKNLRLDEKYHRVRIIPIKKFDWGQEFFIHDPSGILWHVGEFFT